MNETAFAKKWRRADLDAHLEMAKEHFAAVAGARDIQYAVPTLERAFGTYLKAFQETNCTGSMFLWHQYDVLLELLTAVLTLYHLRTAGTVWSTAISLADKSFVKDGVERAVRELVRGCIQSGDLEILERLVDHPDKTIRELTGTTLNQGRPFVRDFLYALVHWRRKGFGLFTREGMQYIDIATFVRQCDSIRQLEWIEQRVQQYFAEWLKQQPSHALQISGRSMSIRRAAIRIIQEIGERKSKLAKEKDGELLAGETIEKPAKGKGIYSVVQRQVCRPVRSN